VASVYLEMHLKLRPQDVLSRPILGPMLSSGSSLLTGSGTSQLTTTGFGSNAVPAASNPIGDRTYASLEYTHAEIRSTGPRRSSLPLRGEIELPPQTVNQLKSNTPAGEPSNEPMENLDADNATVTTTDKHGTLQYSK